MSGVRVNIGNILETARIARLCCVLRHWPLKNPVLVFYWRGFDVVIGNSYFYTCTRGGGKIIKFTDKSATDLGGLEKGFALFVTCLASRY